MIVIVKKILFLLLTTFVFVSCVSDKEVSKTDTVIAPVTIPSENKESITDEYARSVSNLSNGTISTKEFNQDKEEILKIISELSAIMKTKDYNTWLRYLTSDSITFGNNPKNLAAISQRLPIKNYRLQNFQDYFEKVFIPSRMNRVVDEIRYESKEKIKAVQFLPEQDIIYYNFEKHDGKWLLQLDTSS